MSEESKFKLKLLEFGRLHCFTHAKTQRAGGFYNKEGCLCSHPQSRAEAIHISISYTDKLAFLLPGRFPHERMKCERFGGFADACRTAFQVPTETSREGVRSINRQICHLIIQIKNKLVMQTAEAVRGENSHRNV